MAYEIEKRAKLSDKDFERIKKVLEQNGKFTGHKIMKSFLFRDPYYLRIRMIKNNPKIIITSKSGTYADLARKETEKEINKEELQGFLEEIKKEGFVKCSIIKTDRKSYNYNGFNVELNIIDYLGKIVEVEYVTDNENEIQGISNKILDTLKKLSLKELGHVEYQKMMDDMYTKSIKSASKSDFKF